MLSNLINFALIPLFFQDLLLIWFLLEINNFLFICYLSMKLYNKKIIFFYYIVQTMASLLLIFSLIYNNIFLLNMNFFSIYFYIAFMIKLGIPPFHIWLPILSSYLDWNMIFILLTIQKITPFYMISIIKINNIIFYYLILSSSFMSMFKMINLLNMKMILIFSSINQTSWMLFLILMKSSLWLIYMIIYSLILFTLTYTLSLYKFSYNYFFNIYSSFNFNLIYLMMIMNLASIPPLTFFLFKWISIFIFILNSNLHFIFILMIFNSFILIYIYINFMTSILFFYSIKNKFIIKPMIFMNFFKINYSLYILISLMLALLFIII
uniref:NADH dehydrogenase subunit 2 n=1 Tax=Lepisiota frauenfeldi TaxID=610729 RepID=UPI001FA74EEB|nr:NADH dehydrogenase subunit 2 [Lepisiota frauenfeldi]ULM64009.1 NADH dehydrogenase subunit 2 [Lepisiota frauenfeldi]WEY05517.1 NADH dehydrogenase subunit 2 [Lepisiota frauenfeldi]WEY05530.1 NADH dehydrogenase subunit 2 [Lepisiota frauenfeldi]WEY05543.1 NADH dehydrogenase subunit 2 [Lepisiota frauenfeldi]WEY05582.1 NADH dehydrogenase subunit 2 [Lepisiota frauenfeldi]